LGHSNADYLDGMSRLVDIEEATQKLVQALCDPLSSVIRYASLIRAETHEIATRQHIEKLYLEAMNASKVLDTLLTHGSGKASPTHDVIDLNIILTQTIALLRYQMETKGILLDVLLAEGALPVKGDSMMLRQAFYIALLNAMQLQVASRDEKKITLWSRIEGDKIRVDITLGSHGLLMLKGKDLLAQFFETIEKGMGVGWYTLKRNIVDHGGSVAMAGGDSVTFTIKLPFADLETLAEPGEQGSGQLTLGDTHSVRPIALIIDDEVMTAEVTGEMMAHLGFETVCVHDPMSALPILRERHFDLIMIDNQLPKINGITFINEYAPLLRDASVTLMTGDDSVDMSGITGIRKVNLLKKPFALKELKCLVQEMKKLGRPGENR
jgi:CheY-like chemotaxis protein